MKVTDLDGKQSKLTFSSNSQKTNKKKQYSALHTRAVEVVRRAFPTYMILEDYPIKIKRRKQLYFDLFLPVCNLVIEVNGRQHFEYIPHFHSNIMTFIEQQKNDRLKKEWCELNDIEIIDFNYNEEDQWEQLLRI